jgi:hypothetical protein
MKTPDEGIAVAAYGPSQAHFTSRGVPVRVAMDTDYPFREMVTLTLETDRAVRFPLVLRIPAWADGATVRIATAPPVSMRAGSLHRIEREWSGRTELAIEFPMKPNVSVRYNESVCIERGPLVYSLKIGEQWTRVNADKPHRELPHGDFEIRPTTPWNYGLVASQDGVAGLRFEERPVGEQPFSPEGAGMIAAATARRIPSWKIERGWAGELSPADAAWADPSRRSVSESEESVTLIPYGCTNIRITEFPRLS